MQLVYFTVQKFSLSSTTTHHCYICGIYLAREALCCVVMEAFSRSLFLGILEDSRRPRLGACIVIAVILSLSQYTAR